VEAKNSESNAISINYGRIKRKCSGGGLKKIKGWNYSTGEGKGKKSLDPEACPSQIELKHLKLDGPQK